MRFAPFTIVMLLGCPSTVEDLAPLSPGDGADDDSGSDSGEEVEDADGDGVPDDEDAFPDDPDEWADGDGDGIGDNADECPDYDDADCVNGSCETGECVCDEGWGDEYCDRELLGVSGIDPAEAYYPGQRRVTLTGVGFDDSVAVTIDGVDCGDLEVLGATELTCTVPSGSPGGVDVVVTNSQDEPGTLAGGFSYLEFTSVGTLAGTGDDAAEAGAVDGTCDQATFSNSVNTLLLDGDELLVADGLSYAVRSLDLSGLEPSSVDPADATASTLTGDGTSGEQDSTDGTGATAQLRQPDDLAFGSDGMLYVSDTNWATFEDGASALRVVDPSSGDTSTLVTGYKGLGAVAWADGSLFVAECGGTDTILRVESDGTVSTFVGTDSNPGDVDGVGADVQLDCAYALELSADGTSLYVGDFGNYKIKELDLASAEVTTIAGSGVEGHLDDVDPLAAELGAIGRLELAGDYLFITEPGNCAVRQLHLPSGEVSTVVGSAADCGTTDGELSDASLGAVQGIAYDPELGLLLTDTLWGWSAGETSNRIRYLY